MMLMCLSTRYCLDGDLGVVSYAMCFLDDHHFTDNKTESQGNYMTCPRLLKTACRSKNANPAILPPGPKSCEFLAGLVSILVLPISPFPRPYRLAATSHRERSSQFHHWTLHRGPSHSLSHKSHDKGRKLAGEKWWFPVSPRRDEKWCWDKICPISYSAWMQAQEMWCAGTRPRCVEG